MKTRRLAVGALTAAAIYAITIIGVVPIGALGYLNLSDALIMILLTHITPSYAVIVGGLPCALADITTGYVHYAFPTFLIKGLEALAVALIYRRWKDTRISCLVAIVIIALGYGLCDLIMYGSWQVALASLGYNGLQGLLGAVLASFGNHFFKNMKDELMG